MSLRCKVIASYPNNKGRCAPGVRLFSLRCKLRLTLVSLSALRHFDSSVRDKPYK